MIFAANELLAETLTFGEKSGIGQQTVYDLIKGEESILLYHDGVLIACRNHASTRVCMLSVTLLRITDATWTTIV